MLTSSPVKELQDKALIADRQDPSLPSYIKESLRQKLPALKEVITSWIGKEAWAVDGELIDEELADKILPKDYYEPFDAWRNKILRSVFERRFRDIIEKDFAGLLTRFTEKQFPETFNEVLNDVDLQGSSFTAFLKEADELALRDGVCYIYIDAPQFDIPPVSEAQRRNNNLRPYLVLVPRVSFINWKRKKKGGELVLTLAVIEEQVTVDSGLYGEKTETLYRVLFPGGFVVWKIIESPNGFEAVIATDEDGQPIQGETGLDFIPVVPYSLTSNNTYEAEIPLKDLSDLNIELYQVSAENREILHKCNTPTLVINDKDENRYTGAQDLNPSIDITAIGSNTSLKNVEAEWVEPSGVAINSTQTEIEKINKKIDNKTLAFLAGNTVMKTATEVNINTSQAVANFSGIANKKESNVQNILKTWLAYSSEQINENELGIEINKEILKEQVTVTFADLISGFTQGLMSRKLALQTAKRKEVFGSNFTEEDLQAELELSTFSGNEEIGDDTIPLSQLEDEQVITNV